MGCRCTFGPNKDENVDMNALSNMQEESPTVEASRAVQKPVKEVLTQIDEEQTPRDNYFASLLFGTINSIRSNPAGFIETIEHYKQFVVTLKDGKTTVFLKEGTPKIKLKRGVEEFDYCIDLLRRMKPLDELKYSRHLEISIPEIKENWVKSQVIKEKMEEKKKEILTKFDSFSFHYDLGSEEPETSAVLQLVDDSNFEGFRRENILSEDFNYVGISSKSENGKNVCYITFS